MSNMEDSSKVEFLLERQLELIEVNEMLQESDVWTIEGTQDYNLYMGNKAHVALIDIQLQDIFWGKY